MSVTVSEIVKLSLGQVSFRIDFDPVIEQAAYVPILLNRPDERYGSGLLFKAYSPEHMRELEGKFSDTAYTSCGTWLTIFNPTIWDLRGLEWPSDQIIKLFPREKLPPMEIAFFDSARAMLKCGASQASVEDAIRYARATITINGLDTLK